MDNLTHTFADHENDPDILGPVNEETAFMPFPNMTPIAPQGMMRNMAELRAELPNLAILPSLRGLSYKFNANEVKNFDLPDFTQFFLITSNSAVMFSSEGAAFTPVNADGVKSGLFIIPANSSIIMYAGQTRQISIGDHLGAAPIVSVAYYATDKLTVI